MGRHIVVRSQNPLLALAAFCRASHRYFVFSPFIWKSIRGWHLLTHNQQGPQGVSSYAHSLDAIDWTLSPTSPYDCVLEYVDGTHAEASGCGNRPQIMFGEDGETAQFIINGAYAANPTGSKNSWTLFRPITQPGQHL